MDLRDRIIYDLATTKPQTDQILRKIGEENRIRCEKDESQSSGFVHTSRSASITGVVLAKPVCITFLCVRDNILDIHCSATHRTLHYRSGGSQAGNEKEKKNSREDSGQIRETSDSDLPL